MSVQKNRKLVLRSNDPKITLNNTTQSTTWWTQRAVICVNRSVIDKVINISWFDTLTPSNAVMRHWINDGSNMSQYNLALSAIQTVSVMMNPGSEP